MARARNIKPGFFRNEDLVELAFEHRLLFIGLWTLADRDGKLEDRPKRIKMDIFPADNVDVDVGLSELERYGFIERYEVDGKRIVMILKFTEHQSPHHTEKASELPNKDGSITVNEPKKDHPEKDASRLDNGETPDNQHKPDGGNPPDSLIHRFTDSPNPDSPIEHLAADPAPKSSAKPKAKARASPKTPLPAGFDVSEAVRAWAEREGHSRQLQVHFDHFVGVAIARGYMYVNWDQALMNAIRDNWAKVGERGASRPPPNKSFAQQRAEAEIDAFVNGGNDDNVIEMEVRRVGF